MILINSAAFVSEELTNEVGNLPPTLLPVKNKRLFEFQLLSLKFLGEPIYMSLPKNYNLDTFDSKLLRLNNVNIIYLPEKLTLKDSLIESFKMINDKSKLIKIYHGDSLFFNIPNINEEYVLYSKTDDNYNWGFVNNQKKETIYSGFFCVDKNKFSDYLIKKNSFLSALIDYKNDSRIKSIFTDKWYDFGHIHTFYRSRSEMTSSRHFNEIKSNRNTLIKKSNNKLKIHAEYLWFKNLPDSLKINTPTVFNYTENEIHSSYEIEYLYLLPLSELFVFCDLNHITWNNVFKRCKYYLNKNKTFKPPYLNEILNNDLFLNKSLKRLELFVSENNIFSQELKYNDIIIGTLKEIAIESSKKIPDAKNSDIGVLHGDFCFSNILFDFKRREIKVIDPRGLTLNNSYEIYGDTRYDLAKLAHSVIGYYDLIISERYELFFDEADLNFNIRFENENKLEELIKTFKNVFGINEKAYNIILSMVIQLFISMLPLHKDNPKRQLAVIANSLRLYSKN